LTNDKIRNGAKRGPKGSGCPQKERQKELVYLQTRRNLGEEGNNGVVGKRIRHVKGLTVMKKHEWAKPGDRKVKEKREGSRRKVRKNILHFGGNAE